MRWWLQLGSEAAGPGGQCPRGHTASVHAPTDVVCHLHDRVLRDGTPSRRSDLARVDLAHLPLYLVAWLAVRRGEVAPAMVAAAALGGIGIVVHLRRYALTRRVAAWAYGLAALVVGWRAVTDGWPSPAGAVWFVLLVAAGLCLWATARSVADLGARSEPADSPVRGLWEPRAADEDDDATPPVGPRAARLLVAGAVALTLAAYDGLRRPGALRPTVLALVGLVLLVAALLALWTAANARWRDELDDGAADTVGEVPLLDEPAAWDDLRAADRTARRFGLRTVNAALLVLPWMRGERVVTTSERAPSWSRRDWLVLAIDRTVTYARVPVTAALRQVLVPWLASVGVVLLAGACGRLVAMIGTTPDPWRTTVVAVLYGAATVVGMGVVVWLHAGRPLESVVGAVVRTVLVVLPHSLVRLSLVVLLIVPGPTPLVAVVIVVGAVLASLALWASRDSSRHGGPGRPGPERPVVRS